MITSFLTSLIFKYTCTAKINRALNQVGKEKFEELAAEAGLFDARFVEVGQGLI